MKNYFKQLRIDVNKYGFNYSYKKIILLSILIITIIYLISFLSRLKIEYILILTFITVVLIPFMVASYYKQAISISRFNMLTDYLGNIIPIFTQKTKIRYTLGELHEITGLTMKECIGKAIDYLDSTVDDVDLERHALSIIENSFPNSRVKSVHKMLLSIETLNSNVYKDVCQNMYEDIECWIKRVYKFQKDLKNRRIKLLILCMATLFMNAMFSYLYISNEYFVGFTDGIIYQISTLIFISSILITMTLISTKLHGEWLIDDLKNKNEELIKNKYLIYKRGKRRVRLIDILVFMICIVGAIILIIYKNYYYALIAIILSFMVMYNSTSKYSKAYKAVDKALNVEFPIWLREISLSLSNLTVINAIEISQNIASYPLRKEIRKFLNLAKKDPTSIKPYNEFLSDFDLEDARSSMKVLYAIQNVGEEDVKERISNLIVRNQEMLDKAENIRNNDSIGGIEALGYVPTILFSIQMLVSMFSMFSYMMESISGAILV